MKILLIITTIFFQLYSICYAQHAGLCKDGYATFEIKFKGNVPLNKDISNIQGGNMLSYDKPLNAAFINDSTYRISFYTFGPSPVYFTYRNTYFTTVLLPNETDVLEIYHIDTTNFDVNYTGYYKDVFEHSQLISEKIGDMMFSYGPPKFPSDKPIVSANTVKDSYLQQIRQIQNGMARQFNTHSVHAYVEKMAFLMKMNDLLKMYDERVSSHNKNLGLDSLQVLNSIPQKERSFYQGVINELDTDSAVVWPLGYREFVDAILKDPHVEMPPIEEVGLLTYKQNLIKQFDISIANENSIFYDMALAIAYLDKISNGSSLTENERAQISQYYNNKHIVSYIFHVNEMYNKQDALTETGKYLLPFEDTQKDVLKEILSKYKGKAVVIDFWATWCGPCLEALAQMKPIKQKYTHNDDVVFVYITDESSDRGRWNELVNTIEGEHYFLYAEQMKEITNPLDIKFLPSYLFFTKEGELKQSHVDGYVGNVKFSETLVDLTSKTEK